MVAAEQGAEAEAVAARVMVSRKLIRLAPVKARVDAVLTG